LTVFPSDQPPVRFAKEVSLEIQLLQTENSKTTRKG
jgi:hypothetical protein